MWKKVVAILVVVAVALGLAAYGLGPKSIATTNSGSISQAEYYKKLKNTNEGQKQLADMVIQKVLDKKYGDKVSKKSIDKQYNDIKNQYGEQFAQALSSNGMTPDTFKESLKIQALEQAAVEANEKFTKKQMKKQYDAYMPTIKTSAILVSSEDDAKQVIDKLDEGQSFAKVAKKDSIDTNTKAKGGEMPAFDSTDTSLDANFKDAAFKLKAQEYTKTPVKSANGQGYYVIKVNSKAAKKSFKALQPKMKQILVNQTMSDTAKVNAVIGNELAKADVTIKDNALKNALSSYTQAAASAQAAKAQAKSSSAASNDKASSDKSSAATSSDKSSEK